MLKKWLLLLPSLVLLINHISCHKNGTLLKINANKKQDMNEKFKVNRMKRSLSNEPEKILLPLSSKFINSVLEEKENQINSDLEQPFWGMRGRRESSEEELYADDYPQKNCKNCYKSLLTNTGDTKETLSPFWGNRGRRSSEENDDNTIPDNPFWGNRGRRQEDEPFWGTRGRREQELPFWGNRGRGEELKVKNEKFFNRMMVNRDNIEPFWGNRGRRKAEKLTANGVFIDDVEPFWGNRGRRDTMEPFWGSRGRRKSQISSNINTQLGLFSEKEVPKAQLRDYIAETMNNVENNIGNSRLRRSDDFIDDSQKERKTKLANILTRIIGNKLRSKANSIDTSDFSLHFKPTDPETMFDNRMYADQPRYILVERSSRSSAEDDPFFITRGKKFSKFEIPRGRRGAIEELFKSVRNDPYYIARGKKNLGVKIGNATISRNDLDKASELICSTINLLSKRDRNNKVKRDINESDRDRRTILKTLAAQLQDDPYFVSRGKKNDNRAIENENLENLINQMASKCD
ncbi:hypothetical protein RR48_08717 [Papilio machaon]|uniref:Natalisin n=1 Tax=Papilio machaon TaxID=76193 RepID=A0A194R7U0_PAPMA|nr:hypothetical protein RR48_08717 [Papilio machaon]